MAIELPGTAEPRRWIGAEERRSTRRPSGSSRTGRSPTPRSEDAVATIVRRFLQTHALVGLDDLTARYPIDPALADATCWNAGPTTGGLVRLDPAGDRTRPRWADRRNLDEVRRLSIALRRRESVAVRPEVFADFVARRQHVHPATRLEGAAAVGLVLEQLQGFAAPADLWESELLPAAGPRLPPAWLDEALSAGGWLWRAEAGRAGASPASRSSRATSPAAGPLARRSRTPVGGRGAGPRSPGTPRGAASPTDLAAGTRPGAVPDRGGHCSTLLRRGW